ncbi:MAG: helix-turn-helix transcriptional regulator [Firmicutes bacterium]|nr:helix-turn-helix transcriptional regulator [Bacillota bacterium]
MEYKNYVFQITLEDYLKKVNVKRGTLAKRVQSSFQIIDNYCKNKVERLDSYLLLKICVELECELSDILNIEQKN